MGLKKILIIIFILLSFGICEADPKLVWEMPSQGVANGYRIYYGTSRSHLDLAMDVGSDVFEMPLSEFHLESNQRYYFAVSAYNNAGEGPLSNVANHGPKGPMDKVMVITTGSSGQVVKMGSAGPPVKIVE